MAVLSFLDPGYGMERDPIFALECHWHTKDQLLIRPQRPRRT
ncbi:hypothetical protein [Nonomuraea sp. B19D2]